MTTDERDVLVAARDRMGSYRPDRASTTRRALAKLAKRRGLDDDVREVIWAARYTIRAGNPVAGLTAIDRALG